MSLVLLIGFYLSRHDETYFKQLFNSLLFNASVKKDRNPMPLAHVISREDTQVIPNNIPDFLGEFKVNNVDFFFVEKSEF